ncbi:DUF6625 family protein [Pseudomonas berkeleyensis]|uniref:Glycosyl transferase n=1 Tax=Pseudomonas berkeleyensis TaxID=2726956 RepID=A0A7G5DQU4_9PSED|nr:DUF6625 family protein [Pseudomonas berkeleyensis]QMV64119.1 hypothetical protein HS968_03355 [Pseudomonas berkeleyensis]WSO39585.1 DUF6625 family protein [Pseudomonas berkeleyensis]
MSKPRLLFLVPYFGRWPFWMPFFLASCRFNPDVRWLFFTDCGVPKDAPDNVRFRSMSFADYCSKVSAALGVDFQPRNPYKLCDLKPALGYIHCAELEGVDFWGVSDIDLVYGDLCSYFTSERLERFDFLSTHERRVSGHLCLFRNNERMLTAFMKVPGWQAALSSDQHRAFDEGAFSRLFIRNKNWPAPLRRLSDAWNPWRHRCEFSEAFSTPNGRIPWHDGSFEFPQRWIWREGQLFNDRDGSRQFPYFHFIGWKCDAWPTCSEQELMEDAALAAMDSWSITPKGFREV